MNSETIIPPGPLTKQASSSSSPKAKAKEKAILEKGGEVKKTYLGSFPKMVGLPNNHRFSY